MSATNAVHVAASRIRTSTASSSPASLYPGRISLASGVVMLVGRLSASYTVAVVKLSLSSAELAAAAMSTEC